MVCKDRPSLVIYTSQLYLSLGDWIGKLKVTYTAVPASDWMGESFMLRQIHYRQR